MDGGRYEVNFTVENKKHKAIFEHQKGLQLQILEKRKAREIDKAINKEELIFLKYLNTSCLEQARAN